MRKALGLKFFVLSFLLTTCYLPLANGQTRSRKDQQHAQTMYLAGSEKGPSQQMSKPLGVAPSTTANLPASPPAGLLGRVTDGLRCLIYSRPSGWWGCVTGGFANVLDFGAVPDQIKVTDAAISVKTKILTSASNPWSVCPSGKGAVVQGAGATLGYGVLDLVTTVDSCNNAGSLNLHDAATTGVTGAYASVRTDNTAAFAAALAQENIFVPKASKPYAVTGPLLPVSKRVILCEPGAMLALDRKRPNDGPNNGPYNPTAFSEMFILMEVSGVEFRNCGFVGSNSRGVVYPAGWDSANLFILALGASQPKVLDCTFENWWGHAAIDATNTYVDGYTDHSTYTDGLSVKGSTFRQATAWGTNAIGLISSKNADISGWNRLINVSLDMEQNENADAMAANRVEGNYVENATVLCNTRGDAKDTGNSCSRNTLNGSRIIANGVAVKVNFNIIFGNLGSDPESPPIISGSGLTDSELIGNDIDAAGYTAARQYYRGVITLLAPNKVRVAHNNVRNAQHTNGIVVYYGNQVGLAENTVSNNGASGILIDPGTVSAKISGGQLKGNNTEAGGEQAEIELQEPTGSVVVEGVSFATSRTAVTIWTTTAKLLNNDFSAVTGTWLRLRNGATASGSGNICSGEACPLSSPSD